MLEVYYDLASNTTNKALLSNGRCQVQSQTDGGTWTDWKPCTADGSSPYTVSGSSHTYAFRELAADDAGNVMTSTASSTLYDALSPNVYVPSSPAYANTNFTVSWTGATDSGGSGLASCLIQSQTDGGTWESWQNCASSSSAPFNVSGLSHTYTFREFAADNAGNPAASGTVTTTYDAITPTVYVPSAPTYANSSFTVSWTGATDTGGAGISSCQVQSQTDGGTWVDWQDCTLPGPATFNVSGSSHTYAFREVATDRATNPATSEEVSTIYDTQAPVTLASVECAPGNDGWCRSDATVTLTVTDTTGSGVLATTYHVDGGNWTAYTAPFSVTGDLVHTLEYHSSDYAGNVEVTRTLAVKIDALAPQVTGLTVSPEVFSPNGDGRQDTTTISATVAETYLQSWTLDILSGTQVVSHSVGTTSAVSVTWDGSGRTGDGIYTLWLTATDQAGNVGSASGTVQVATSAPTLVVVEPPAPGAVVLTDTVLVAGQVTTPSVDLSVTILPEGGGTQTLPLTIQPGGTFSQSVSGLAAGNNTLRFLAQDAGGNQTVVTRTVAWDDAPPGVTVIHYTYDSLKRLTQASYSTGEVYEYTYDAAGNRLAENSPAGFKTYAYDDADRLTSVNSQAYTWDDNGNLLDDGQRTFTYNSANQLTQVVSGTLTTQYAYSGDGVRRSQTANGVETRYTVDVATGLPQVLQETRGSNTTRYLYGLDQLATQDSGTWAYHHPDGLGSVRQMSDASGQVLMARSYTPFGAVKSQAGTANGSFGYAGEQQDAASDLTFLRARYYDPSTGRFLTRDPYPAYATVPSTLHRYAYAANNPVNLTDPSGLMPDLSTFQSSNNNSWSPPQPSVSQYDQTGWAGGLLGVVDAANQLSRALSQGARPLGSRPPNCGPTGVLGDFCQ